MTVKKTSAKRPVEKKAAAPKQKPVGLWPRILQVQSAIAESGPMKNKGSNAQQGYNYLADEDLTPTISREMTRAGLALVPPDVIKIENYEIPGSRGSKPAVRVTVVFGIVDCETGEKFQSMCVGDSFNIGGKGVFAAMTGARKYFFRLAFNVASSDDPEAHEHNPGRPDWTVVVNWHKQEIGALLDNMLVPRERQAGVIDYYCKNVIGSEKAQDWGYAYAQFMSALNKGYKYNPATGVLAIPAQAETKAQSDDSAVEYDMPDSEQIDDSVAGSDMIAAQQAPRNDQVVEQSPAPVAPAVEAPVPAPAQDDPDIDRKLFAILDSFGLSQLEKEAYLSKQNFKSNKDKRIVYKIITEKAQGGFRWDREAAEIVEG